MAYQPNQSPTWAERDGLDPNDSRRIIKGADFGAEFDNIKSELDRIEDGLSTVGTTKNVFAALTYNGSATIGSPHNIKNVEWVTQTNEGSNWKFCRVEFVTGQDGTPNNSTPPSDGGIGNGTLDADLNIQVTPFSNADNSAGFAGFVFATITEITNYYVEVAFVQNGFSQDQAVWNQAFCLLVARN